MKTTPFTGAATRGIAALAALLVFAACDDAETPTASTEAGSKVAPIDPAAIGSTPETSEGSPSEPAPRAIEKDPAPRVAPPVAEPAPVDTSPGSRAEDDAPTLEVDPDAAFAVVEFGVGSDVAGRELQGRATRFGTDVGTLHAWTKLKNDGDPRDIDMIWRKQGVETFRYQLTIGKSPSWRTWSKKTITEDDSGFWSVEIVTKSGDVLATQKFTID